MNITLEPDGRVSFIGDLPIELPLADTVRRRVSTIQPAHKRKRIAFLLLRTVFGEAGRVAAFTRTWSGPWRVTILATGETAVFLDRQAAVDWELEVLNPPLFDL